MCVRDRSSPYGPTSLFYDDLELMRTRIDRLEHPLIHVQTPPSNTVHLIGSVTTEPGVPATDPESGLPASVVLGPSSALTHEHRLGRTLTLPPPHRPRRRPG